MKHILIIGSGARECMIIKALKKGSEKINISCIGTNRNPYIDKHSLLYITDINTKTIEVLITIIGKLDYVIIGPETPLRDGLADYFESLNIPCIGPLQYYAQIETSKIFARKFIDSINLTKYSPKYIVVDDSTTKINEFINEFMDENKEIVIKKNGLCGGKGVLVQGIDFNTLDDVQDILLSENILIEEKLEGEEFSLMSITDGNGSIRHFPPVQDYKRLNDCDLGPNTGSMGCLIDKNNSLPFLNDTELLEAQTINSTVITELNKQGKTLGYSIGYRGVLYGSYIKTNEGVKIIEFNSRFGDPEGIIALNLLENSFLDVCDEIAKGDLTSNLTFSQKAAIGIYMVPKTYPQATSEKYDIYIDPKLNINNLIFGAVEKHDSHLYSLSSRSLFYFVKGVDLSRCYTKVYQDIQGITGNLRFRTDIGSKYLTHYDKAGVSIERGNEAIKEIKHSVESTYTTDVLGKHGDFGGQFKLGEHTLVSSIDGVGTKSILARRILGDESFINLGRDIVNHSVNDILVQGAYPLFFMDYFGTHSLKLNEIANFIKGVSLACIENGKFPLLGGETAEMPRIYIEDETDLVGCIIGLKDPNFFKTGVQVGDVIISLESDGPHTNGFSLLNNMFENHTKKNAIIETLLNPHKSYLNDVKIFLEKYDYEALHGMAHITGGGLKENISRVIPDNLTLNLDYDKIKRNLPEWCVYIMENTDISFDEMLSVFNCGIGYVLIVPPTINLDNYNVIGKLL
jgi:phosphoribosylamine--glycine ligase/phosphoribosylformylglycinamidine cyclo-ligase